jgi:hypothetical protein
VFAEDWKATSYTDSASTKIMRVYLTIEIIKSGVRVITERGDKFIGGGV